MKIKQKITIFATFLAVIGAVALSAAPQSAYAQGEAQQGPPNQAQGEGCPETSIVHVDCEQGDVTTQESGVWQLLLLTLNILTAGVGIAAVGGIVWGSVLYASAQGNADQVKKAKEIIKNVVIGIVSYAGMYLIINFLIPGGLFT